MADRRFYGWYVAAASGIGLACSIGTIVAATFSVFLGPIRAELGWSASETYSALIVVTFTTAVLSPIVGGIVDRFGARRVILASFAFEVLIFVSFHWQTAALWTFYARYVLLATLALGATHVGFARVISLWFNRRRGLALGLALAGIGVGGFVWPIMCQYLIQTYDWRTAYVVLALVLGAVSMPLVALVVRDSPESVGQHADGDPVPQGSATQQSVGITLREASGRGLYWVMLVTFLGIGITVQSIMLHLIPILTGRGVSPMMAAIAQSTLFLALVAGRLVTGWLMDRFFAPRVALAFLLAPIVGIAMLATGASGVAAFSAALLVGLAAGAEVDVIAYLTGRYYGLKYFSRIYGTYYGAYTLGGGVGPVATAKLVEMSGGYTVPLWMLAAMVVGCCLLLLRFPRFPAWQAPAPSPDLQGEPARAT
jgi:MFS family permease